MHARVGFFGSRWERVPGMSAAASEVATSSAYTSSSAGAGGQWGWSATVGVGAIASA